jgi:hypothetical protein
MPRLTKEQRGRTLERIASILHEEMNTEGFHDLVQGMEMDGDAAHALVCRERDAYLRRAARALGGEASTHNGTAPATFRRSPR